MRWFLAIVVLSWLAILPPFFTDGKCTDEFEAASTRFETHKSEISKLVTAKKWLTTSEDNYSEITQPSCRAARPRFIAACSSGSILYVVVPVKDRICSLYRDDATRVQLHYDDKGNLSKILSDMAPFKSLPLPGGGAIHWSK